MCHINQLIARCPDCPWTTFLGLDLRKCNRPPANTTCLCKTFTTSILHRPHLCAHCDSDPAETRASHQVHLLSEQIRLRIQYLRDVLGDFPDSEEGAWEEFWRGLDEGAKELFMEIWSLEGEREWLVEEGMREGV